MRVQLAGVAKHYGAQVVLDQVSLTIGPRARVGLVGPNGVGKSTLLRIVAGHRGARRRRRLTRARASDRRLPRAGACGGVGRVGRRGARAANRRPGGRARARGIGGRARAERVGIRPLLRGARALPRARRCGLPRPARARPAPSWGSASTSTAGSRASRAARPRASLWPRSSSRASTSSCSTSRRTTSTSTGSSASRASSRRIAARSSSSPTTAPSSIEPLTGSPRSSRTHGSVREWAGGWSDYESARDAERAAALAAFEQAQARRRQLTELLGTRRTEARAKGASLGDKTGGQDRRATHALETKVRQAERLLERNELPAKPFEPWELNLTLRAGVRQSEQVLELTGAVGQRGAFRLGPDRPRPRTR